MTGQITITYPELYKEEELELQDILHLGLDIHLPGRGSSCSELSCYLKTTKFIHVVAISFTALILMELVMVALTIIVFSVCIKFQNKSFPV